jgi:hypothetical protein
MGGRAFVSALTRAWDTVGAKPARLAGAISPRAATGSEVNLATSSDGVLGVEVL